MKTGIHIEGGKGTPFQRQLATLLAKQLELALTLGRTDVGIEIAKQIGELGGVKNTTITNCSIGTAG